MTTAAIMQPTYLPWLGYFDLIAKTDHFIFLDTVHFNTRSWQTRNRIRTPDGETHWLTIPVKGGQGQPISQVRIDNSQPWRRKHWGTIHHAYKQASHYADIRNILFDHYADNSDRSPEMLCWTTYRLILDISDYLHLSGQFHFASQLPSTSTDRVGRLADLCRHVGADTLIEPTGGIYLQGRDRLDDDIGLQWHDYHHPIYSQGGQPFCSHLSVIDLIAWHGPDSLNIIRQQKAVAA